MDCAKCRTSLPLCADNDADEATLRAVAEHVAACPECARQMEKYSFLKELLGSMYNLDDIAFNFEQFAAETVSRAVRAAEKPRPSHNRFKARLVLQYAVAAVFVIAAVGLFGVGLISPEQSDQMNMAAAAENTDPAAAEEPTEMVSPPRVPSAADPEERTLRPVTEYDLAILFHKDDAVPKGAEFSRSDPGRMQSKRSAVQNNPNACWFGLRVREFRNAGLLVERVIGGGPAEGSGLQIKDVITAVNGRSLKHTAALLQLINRMEPGEEAVLTVIRGSQVLELTLTAARKPLHL